MIVKSIKWRKNEIDYSKNKGRVEMVNLERGDEILEILEKMRRREEGDKEVRP